MSLRVLIVTVIVLSGTVLWSSAIIDIAQAKRATSIEKQLVIKDDSDNPLQVQIHTLFAALNHRDLNVIKSQISPSRIYVEISDKTGAYLTNGQTLAVLESFLRSHTSLSAKLEFDNTDGDNGSASGTLTARRNSRIFTYRLNFGFTKNDRGTWLLTRISMR